MMTVTLFIRCLFYFFIEINVNVGEIHVYRVVQSTYDKEKIHKKFQFHYKKNWKTKNLKKAFSNSAISSVPIMLAPSPDH